MSIDETFGWNVYFLRCPDCRRPIQNTGQPTMQRFDYYWAKAMAALGLNRRHDIVYDRDPRPGLPPMGYAGWCKGHEEKVANGR